MARSATQKKADRPAKSGKGERTKNQILKAFGAVVTQEGLSAASQDHVAHTAGISQSTLRHYFATKDELITGYFTHYYQVYRENIENILLQPQPNVRLRLREIAKAHLEHIRLSSDVAVFESWALMCRDEAFQTMRDEWITFLSHHYAALIQQLHPDLPNETCLSKANQILTVSFGAWVTIGRNGPRGEQAPTDLMEDLLMLIDQIIDA